MVLTETSTDYSNRILGSQKEQVKQMDKEETLQKDNMLFSSQEFSQKLQKENMTLMKALAHRNKIIELSGVEFQKLRVQLHNMQEKNLELARANSQMLAELNTSRDRLKELQHELGCKNVLLKVNKQLEEKVLLCTHESKDKDMNHKDTKRKRTSRIKPSGISDVNPIHMNEIATSKRKLSEVIDTTGIPEETYQTEDDNRKGVISSGVNQIVDTVMNKNVLDAANPVKHNVHSKRFLYLAKEIAFLHQCISEIVYGNDTFSVLSRLSLRRQSARLRPEEAEPCKSSFHEGDEVRETTKRRVSSRKLSARFDSKEPKVTETLKADDETRSLISEESLGSRSEAIEPSESRHDIKETNRKRRVSTRKQSTIGKSQTEEAFKETATDPSSGKNIVQDCVKETETKETTTNPSPGKKTEQDCDQETETKKKPKADENEEMIRRTSVRRPSRHAAEKVQSYKEVSLKVKMRRN